jgi:hypothetical protein
MAQGQDKIKELENYLNSLPAGKEKDFVKKVLEETRRFETMSDAEVKVELSRSKQEAAAAEERLKLLEMDEAARKKELERRKAEAERAKAAAEKEWEEAVAAATPTLIQEDVARRKAEQEAAKTVSVDETGALIENFKTSLGKKDLAGCGAVLKRLAVSGRTGDILNYYGYPSNVAGLHQFFNETIIGERPIIGEKAFDNFLFQQRAYALEQDISCLAEGFHYWSLAFAMGRKGRAWYQLGDSEHLLAVLWAVRKIDPATAARIFGQAAYGFFTPREKFQAGGEGNFSIGREGELILMLWNKIFEKQLAQKDFNPEAAEVLAMSLGELDALGLAPSFAEALKKYVDELKIKPEMAEEVRQELVK